MKRELSNGEYEIIGLAAAKKEIEDAVLYEIFVTVDFRGTPIPIEIDKYHASKFIEMLSDFGPEQLNDIPILHVIQIEGGFLSISFVDSEMVRQEQRDPI